MRSKKTWKLVWLGGCALLFLFIFFSFQGVRNPSWNGSTMGTHYSITLVDRLRPAELRKIKMSIEHRLGAVNDEMSMWDPASELSRFNQTRSVHPFPVSAPLAKVVAAALEMSEQTGGLFDPTIKPLVDYWGFGARHRRDRMSNIERGMPNTEGKETLEFLMEFVGWEKVLPAGNSLSKKEENVQIDLSAIAKGYGVDEVAGVIRSFGITNFLVEIGGEIHLAGLSPDQKPWRIGIESPDAGCGVEVFQTLELRGGAMATSGDYRNIRAREDGTRYSHIINPKTGRPAETDIASVSVLAGSCMDADAAATALFVMGSKKGFQWLETHPEFEAFFILHSVNQTFRTLATDGFPVEP